MSDCANRQTTPMNVTLGVHLDCVKDLRTIGITTFAVRDIEPHGGFVTDSIEPISKLAGSTGNAGRHALYGAYLDLWSKMDRGQSHAKMKYGRDVVLTIQRQTFP